MTITESQAIRFYSKLSAKSESPDWLLLPEGLPCACYFDAVKPKDVTTDDHRKLMQVADLLQAVAEHLRAIGERSLAEEDKEIVE